MELDGFLIPGGSDINPCFYGEENAGSIISADADQRFLFLQKIYQALPRKAPVLGICFGFEFINIMHGGSLLQDIADKSEHNHRRKIAFKPGSKMHSVYGSSVFGHCFHHQALKVLGTHIEVTAWDDFSQIAHAIELKDAERSVSAVLFHPEITSLSGGLPEQDLLSLRIFQHFVHDCRGYSKEKLF